MRLFHYRGSHDMTVTPIASSSKFVWIDDFLLGFGPMDRTHEEFVHCVRALLDAPDDKVAVALSAFAEHAERHFKEENDWMRETRFPPADCHVDEHAAVLRSVHEVQAALDQGAPVALARDLAGELARWFPGHADHLDSALAHWMSQRRFGGRPIVLKRSLRAATGALETGT
jgi:hemerythrin